MKRILTVFIALALVLSFSVVSTAPVAAANGPPVASGLVLHLDASDSDSITKDGDNKVSQWDDLSGEDNHATQGTSASQPEWVEGALAGKPVVRFDGENDHLYRAVFLTDTASVTILVLFRSADASQERQPVFYTGAGDSDGYGIVVNSESFAGEELNVLYGGVAWHQTEAPIVDDQWYIACLTVRPDGSPLVHLDGDEVYSGTGTPNTPTGYTGVGHDNQSADLPSWLKGDIAEILIYDRTLTTQERVDMEWYLGEKWLGWERPAEVWVCDAHGDDGNPGTFDHPFETIQHGITVVAAGGTVNVKAGTYTESVTITRSLTLQSTQGAGETTITGLVTIDLDDGQTVVFGGAEDAGFTVDRGNPIPDSGLLLSVDNGSDVTIGHNIITGGDVGIRSEAGGIQGGSTVTIEHNVISDNSGEGIYLGLVNASDIDIRGNIIGGDTPDDGNGGAGIRIYEILSNSTVTIGGDSEDDGNTISQNGLGVPMTGIHIEWVYASDVTIENNAITDNQGSGICIENIGLTMGTVTIARNIIADNGAYGISINQIDGSTVLIDGNKVGAWEEWKGNDDGGINIGDVLNNSSLQITANHANENCANFFGIQINIVDGSTVNIEDNETNGNVNGIIVHSVEDGGALYVVGNTIAENHFGLLVWGVVEDAAVVILGNVVEDNIDGIKIGHVADSTARINFNNIFGNQAWGVLFEGNPTTVDATHNWWGDADGPKHEDNPYFDTTEGDAVSDNVDFTPWLGAAMTDEPTGCTTDRATGEDAYAETDNLSATSTGGNTDTTVTLAEYVGNPTSVDPGFAMNGEFFFDVHVGGPAPYPSQLVVEFNCPGGNCSGVVLKWFDGTAWRPVTPVSYTNGTIVATLDGESSPTIAQLTGTPFGMGNPLPPPIPPVGGTAYPANTLTLLAPWIALGAAIMAGAAVFMRRRQTQN